MFKQSRDAIWEGTKHQYVIKNMQEMGFDKYQLTKDFYGSYEEAVGDVGQHGPEWVVWGRFENPGFRKREERKDAVCQFKF